jgi:integrase
MSRVKKQSHEPKSIIWTKEQVKKFIDVAFSKFKYRNVGLIALMCYEWAQRPIDIRNLKWSNIDFENKKVTIRQTKRGATVQLPLEEPLFSLLKDQKELWDFQEYVLPYLRLSDNAYRPLNTSAMSTLVKEVKEIAGLPKELALGHLRKTAINEMVEASIDSTSIMQVTGHRNIESLSPYIKHTYSGAKSALAARSAYKDTMR